MSLTLGQLALYAGALFALFLTPGPVWLATAARSLAQGVRGAVPLVFGVAVGDAIWSIAVLLGIAWILPESTSVLAGLKWLAVALFAIMGGLLIWHAEAKIDTDAALNRPGLWAGFAAGLVAVMANPKAALFYIGLVPSFFDVTAIGALDVIVVAAISMAVPLIGNLGLAAIVGGLRQALTAPGALTQANRIAGGALILVAVVIAVTTP